MCDEWGGIDKNIQYVVTALNARGISTTGSCEGHLDHGSPVPWVGISGDVAQDKLETVLNNFYHARVVSSDVRITFTRRNFGYWLHNGGDLFGAWHAHVDEIVESKKTVKSVLSQPPQLNAKNFEIKLQEFQKEFEEFAQFLEK